MVVPIEQENTCRTERRLWLLQKGQWRLSLSPCWDRAEAALSRGADAGRAPASASARRHQGRIRPRRALGREQRAGAAPVQYRRFRATAGELRTRGYYLGSNVSYNLKKWSRWATSITSSAAHGPPVGARQPDRKGPPGGRHRQRASMTATSARSIRWAASAPTISTPSTARCSGWSASGPTRSSTGWKICLPAARPASQAILRRHGPGLPGRVDSDARGPLEARRESAT